MLADGSVNRFTTAFLLSGFGDHLALLIQAETQEGWVLDSSVPNTRQFLRSEESPVGKSAQGKLSWHNGTYRRRATDTLVRLVVTLPSRTNLPPHIPACLSPR